MTVHPAALAAVQTYADLIQRRKFVAAEIVMRRAIAVAPNAPELWCNLGTALWNQRRPREALKAAQESLRLRPGYPFALATLGLASESLHRFDEADVAFSQSLEGRPDDVETQWNRALLRIGVRDFVRGFAAYESRIERKPDLYPPFMLPRWRGEPLDGKTVLVIGEQGYGDTILFSRFLPHLVSCAKKVLVTVSLTMVQLLWEFRHLVEFLPDGVPLPEADFYMHMGSLPLWYGLGENPSPPDPGLISRRVDAQHALNTVSLPQTPSEPGALKIGVCWTGNPAMERNDERTVPLASLARLAGDPWVWLYSLQASDAAEDIAALGLEDLIVDLRPQMGIRGYVGTGCLMRQLDLVITCCTSVAHLAGVLNVPCWVLLCKDPYWIWGKGTEDESYWYPSVRLFRQGLDDDWDTLIDRAKDALLDLEPRSMTLLAAE